MARQTKTFNIKTTDISHDDNGFSTQRSDDIEFKDLRSNMKNKEPLDTKRYHSQNSVKFKEFHKVYDLSKVIKSNLTQFFNIID